jgi:DNA-binding MarR family transcriptional regulator
MVQAADTAELASELRVVVGQLIRRLRAEHPYPLPQLAVLARLDRSGTCSVGELAVAERIRPQSMTVTVNELAADGMVARRPDPGDGRRTLVELTERGRATLEQDRRLRESWLARAIADDLGESERRLLERVLPLLRRLAED